MRVFLYIILGAVVFVLYVRYLERMSVFYPDRDIKSTPADIGLKYEDVFFPVQGNVKLHGWFVPKIGAKSTVLFFHGNAGNIGDRVSTVKFYYDLGLNIFVIDYRGFGESQGNPSERTLYSDAQSAFDYLRLKRGIKEENIIVYGASLGGVAAVDVASKNKVAALILDSAFTSAKDMSEIIYPYIPTALLSLKLDNLSKIKNVNAPKLFVHSKDDRTVPYFIGKKLFDEASEPKELITVSGLHDEIRKADDAALVTETGLRFLKTYNLN